MARGDLLEDVFVADVRVGGNGKEREDGIEEFAGHRVGTRVVIAADAERRFPSGVTTGKSDTRQV
jgi:hypothetical protein